MPNAQHTPPPSTLKPYSHHSHLLIITHASNNFLTVRRVTHNATDVIGNILYHYHNNTVGFLPNNDDIELTAKEMLDIAVTLQHPNSLRPLTP